MGDGGGGGAYSRLGTYNFSYLQSGRSFEVGDYNFEVGHFNQIR